MLLGMESWEKYIPVGIPTQKQLEMKMYFIISFSSSLLFPQPWSQVVFPLSDNKGACMADREE